LKLQFESTKEQDRLDRVERLLGGKLRGKVRQASELAFNYDRATQKHQESVLPRRRLDSHADAPRPLGGD